MPSANPVLIYLAGPLFSEAERSFNEVLTERLEESDFRVFLPQRDGVEREKAPYKEMSPEERRQAMFELDETKIMEANVFLFVLDGRVPDEGACVELGIAHTHRRLGNVEKLLVGLHTDTRAAFTSSKLNPMVRIPLDRIAEDESSLIEILEGYRILRVSPS